MRRFLSIAIFSALLCAAEAQSITNRNGAVLWWVLDPGALRLSMRMETTGSVVLNGTRNGPSPGTFTVSRLGAGNTTVVQWNTAGLLPGQYTFTPTGYSANNTTNTVLPPVMRVLWTNGILSVWQDDLATNSFSWQFPPEWAGSTLQIRATNGQSLATYGLPAVIGPGGYTLASSIVTNQSLLTGAQVFIDGQSVASLASSSSNSNWAAYRPGYDIEFDGSYKDGDWRIQRSDGTIALSGSVATLNDAINGRFTVTGTNSATMWTRVPGGDGNGGTWVPSPVTFGQNNTTVSYFFSGATNPTNVPVPTPPPTPTPTPAPVATPAPATTNVTTNTVQPDELVNVDVPDAPELDGEFGAADVVEEARGVFGKVAEGYENFAEAFTNAALTFNEFKNIYLPPPGSNCTFSFGPVSVNLSAFIPGWVRGASKLVFLFVALAAMKRMLWEAFA